MQTGKLQRGKQTVGSSGRERSDAGSGLLRLAYPIGKQRQHPLTDRIFVQAGSPRIAAPHAKSVKDIPIRQEKFR